MSDIIIVCKNCKVLIPFDLQLASEERRKKDWIHSFYTACPHCGDMTYYRIEALREES